MIGCLLVPVFVVFALLLLGAAVANDPVPTIAFLVVFVGVARIGLHRP